MVKHKARWLLVGWLLSDLTATQALRVKSATACAQWVIRGVAMWTVSIVLILLVSGCVDRSVYYNDVRYDTLEEANAAARVDDAAMWAKINRRDHPLVGPALFFRPSVDYLFEWLQHNKHYFRCVLFNCRGKAEIDWEIEIEANNTYRDHFSTATAIEHSNIFESVSIESYDDPSDIPQGDPIRFMIVIRPTSIDASWSWSLWAPGSSASARLPGFDHSIKLRERRVNDWIDWLESTSLKEMGLVYRDQSRFDEAEPLLKQAFAILKKVLGPEHLNVATSLENYAAVLRETEREDKAEELEARAKAIRAKAE